MKDLRIGFQHLIIAMCLLACSSLASAQDVVTYYHTDLAGSPIAATNESGAVVWREEFTPYGERSLRQISSGSNRLWFTGHHHDDETGLTYAGARHYDPMIGRFMGVDPAEMDPANQFTFNRYAYANNNPFAYADPDGAEVGAAYRAIYLADGGRNQKIGPADRTLPREPIEYFIGGGLGLVALPILALGGYELGLAALANPATTSALTITAADVAAGGAVVGSVSAAGGAARAATSIGTKIEKQLVKRGWSRGTVDDAIANPTRTVATRDTRHLPGGGRMNDPATAYYGKDGGYVVRNDRTGDIVQVSDRTDAGWRAPWD